MFQVINWRRMFADLGWVMAMADPTCYSQYLATRADRISRDRPRDIDESRMVFQRPKFQNRAPFKALSRE